MEAIMAAQLNDDTLAANRLLNDQLLQARADLHRLGVNDQNRALLYAAVSGAVGIVVGLAVGFHAGKKPR
jgi:hypothetical protein